ncbi:hypothetical protein SPF06_19175 [Sinomonas sp. JGH33]|uniref:Uncharacterized protein n=1 Tax=Sinomonas terricola TaxID=3110330 RepID=A0ABU5TAZ3_9MICC|nr:hypothetical protein [Sinomonas sp. JGH33]MEA5456849.1 hypothetical protein [Sinomonas sp. JGH33]
MLGLVGERRGGIVGERDRGQSASIRGFQGVHSVGGVAADRDRDEDLAGLKLMDLVGQLACHGCQLMHCGTNEPERIGQELGHREAFAQSDDMHPRCGGHERDDCRPLERIDSGEGACEILLVKIDHGGEKVLRAGVPLRLVEPSDHVRLVAEVFAAQPNQRWVSGQTQAAGESHQ